MENLSTEFAHTKLRKNFYEKVAWKEEMVVCGVDEVGRGCLAGPLVTGAVILPKGCTYRRLKDSKILTEKERKIAYRWITNHCWHATGIVSSQTIDTHNIWQATLMAMKKAVLNLLAICPEHPSAFLIDAMPLKMLDTNYKKIPIYHFPKGESKSISIAAASIIAKVTRDHLMQSFCPIFPGYSLEQHKGYGTKKHKEAIRRQGSTIIHRTSFLSNTLNQESNEYKNQQGIF